MTTQVQGETETCIGNDSRKGKMEWFLVPETSSKLHILTFWGSKDMLGFNYSGDELPFFNQFLNMNDNDNQSNHYTSLTKAV